MDWGGGKRGGLVEGRTRGVEEEGGGGTPLVEPPLIPGVGALPHL